MLDLGDLDSGVRVRCAAWRGTVVFNTVTLEWSTGYAAADWQHLGPGCMVAYVEAGLVCHSKMDEDLRLDGSDT